MTAHLKVRLFRAVDAECFSSSKIGP